jgi:hypothetical protein
VHVLEAVEQVAFGVSIHIPRTVVATKTARFALRRPAGTRLQGGIGGGQDAANKPIPAHNLQHAIKQVLRADQALRHMDAVGTLHGAAGAIATATAVCPASSPRNRSPQGELAVAIGIGEEAKYIRHRQALAALAFTFAAHTAVHRADVIQLQGQDFFIRRENGCRKLEVLLQLIHVGHARDGGMHMGFRTTHLSAASIAPSRFSSPGSGFRLRTAETARP